MAARQVEPASAAARCEQVFVLQNNEGLNEEQSLDYGNEHEFTKVLEYSPFPRYRGIIYILTSFGHLCVCLVCVSSVRDHDSGWSSPFGPCIT